MDDDIGSIDDSVVGVKIGEGISEGEGSTDGEGCNKGEGEGVVSNEYETLKFVVTCP